MKPVLSIGKRELVNSFSGWTWSWIHHWSCWGLNVHVSSKFGNWLLTPLVMICGDGTFGGWSRHKWETLAGGGVCILPESPGLLSFPPCENLRSELKYPNEAIQTAKTREKFWNLDKMSLKNGYSARNRVRCGTGGEQNLHNSNLVCTSSSWNSSPN